MKANRKFATEHQLLVATLALTLCTHGLAGEQGLTLLNQATREVKQYEFGASPFKVDMSFVPGWSQCTGKPVKEFMFSGVASKRLELWCDTRSGAAVVVSCVASRSSPSVTIQQLLADGYKHHLADDRVDARAAVELTLTCSLD